MNFRHVLGEGRCVRCGQRVTVSREGSGHTRAGRWCGPVETDRPSVVPDDPPGDQWVAKRLSAP